MLEVLLIRPGSTQFDEEGRIKGSLDIPLGPRGRAQAEELSVRLQTTKLDCLYVAPCESAQDSARAICERNFCRQRSLDCLRNWDHGLWQGKLVAEVKRTQPKVYRQFQENPGEVCPPGGETIDQVIARVEATIRKLLKRHDGGRIGLIVPQPMASIVRMILSGGSIDDIWKCELDFGTYETIQVAMSAPVAGGTFIASGLAPV